MDHEEYTGGLPQGCADSRDVTRVGKEESHSQKKTFPSKKKTRTTTLQRKPSAAVSTVQND